MKIIIAENKLEKVIGKWLSKKYSELDIYDHDNQPWVMYVDKDGDIFFLYQYKQNELYVDKSVIKFLFNIFFIDELQLKSILENWFEEHTGLKISKVMRWNFTDDSDWKKVVRWETKKRLT